MKGCSVLEFLFLFFFVLVYSIEMAFLKYPKMSCVKYIDKNMKFVCFLFYHAKFVCVCDIPIL